MKSLKSLLTGCMFSIRVLNNIHDPLLFSPTIFSVANNFQLSNFSDSCKNKKSFSKSLTTMSDQQEKKCSFVKEEAVAAGKWLGLKNITYTDPTGRTRSWEAAHRTTRRSGDAVDAVCSVPILKRLLHYDSVILVKQYRPPMKAYTIEFPAGLLDPDERPEACALRELKEETGYTGVAKHTSPATALDPGLSNTTVQLVTVEIDGDMPENEKHAQQQDEGEFIEVLTIPLDGMLQKLNELASEGHVIDSRVYSYAVAREQQKNIKPSI